MANITSRLEIQSLRILSVTGGFTKSVHTRRIYPSAKSGAILFVRFKYRVEGSIRTCVALQRGGVNTYSSFSPSASAKKTA